MKMFGPPRDSRTRLYKTANPNDNSITVEPGLDWVANDTIAIAMTRIQWNEADYAVIKSYNNVTGVATLDRPLNFYHFGQATSTGPNYSGVDMRAEVLMLSRNIKIAGNDSEAWGCQVVTSDFLEGNGEQRYGRTFLNNVEIYNCS
jgi:hypothetical protein